MRIIGNYWQEDIQGHKVLTGMELSNSQNIDAELSKIKKNSQSLL